MLSLVACPTHRTDWVDIEDLSKRVVEAKEVIYQRLTQEMGIQAFPGTTCDPSMSQPSNLAAYGVSTLPSACAALASADHF